MREMKMLKVLQDFTLTMRRAELMKKMIFILLLLDLLTFTVCETFEVRCGQSFYQGFMNQSITLEWMFTNCSLDSLHFICFVFDDQNVSVLFEYVKGSVVLHHGLFKGRVQLDKDVLRERRIRLHVSSLRTEDSGLYICDVTTREGRGEASCHINVSDKLQTTPETKFGTEPEPKHIPEGVWICLGFGLSVFVLYVCGFIYLRFFRAESGGHSEDRDTNEAGHKGINVAQTDETRQTEVSALRETVDNLNLHESSSSVRLNGHHVPTEHECQTLKLTEQETVQTADMKY